MSHSDDCHDEDPVSKDRYNLRPPPSSCVGRPTDDWIRANVTSGLRFKGGPSQAKRRRVSLPGEPNYTPQDVTTLTSVTHEGLTYTVGQDVCVDGYYDRGESGNDEAVVDAIPWYARIRNMYLVRGETPTVEISLQWWYRPQDLPLYRRHGHGELYFSLHWEGRHPVSCLKYPIEVVSEADISDDDPLGHYVFFARTTFYHKKRKFKALSPTSSVLRRSAALSWSCPRMDLPVLQGRPPAIQQGPTDSEEGSAPQEGLLVEGQPPAARGEVHPYPPTEIPVGSADLGVEELFSSPELSIPSLEFPAERELGPLEEFPTLATTSRELLEDTDKIPDLCLPSAERDEPAFSCPSLAGREQDPCGFVVFPPPWEETMDSTVPCREFPDQRKAAVTSSRDLSPETADLPALCSEISAEKEGLPVHSSCSQAENGPHADDPEECPVEGGEPLASQAYCPVRKDEHSRIPGVRELAPRSLPELIASGFRV